MAVFTSTRQLSQQKKHTPFEKVTGWKKGALAMMGHKDTGEKNWFGKYLGGSIGMTIGANILTSGTDAGEVTKSQRGAEASHQVGVMSFVGSIMGASGGGSDGGGMLGGMTGGGGGAAASGGAGATAGASGAATVGNSSTSGTGMLSGNSTAAKLNVGQGGGKQGRMERRDTRKYNKMMGGDSMFKDEGNLAQTEGGKRLTKQLDEESKQRAIDEMNQSAGDELAYKTEADYLGQPKEGDAGFSEQGGFTSEMGEYGDATKDLALVGEGVGLYAEKMAIADAYKNERKKLAARTTAGSDIRRA